jgi:hypothetical protein
MTNSVLLGLMDYQARDSLTQQRQTTVLSIADTTAPWRGERRWSNLLQSVEESGGDHSRAV